MVINYKFNGEFFDYEIDHEQYQKSLIHLLLQQDKLILIEMILNFDGCVVDLENDFKDELKDHFEQKAYKEYLDRGDV